MCRLIITFICCYFGIGCQNNTKQIYIEDYIKTSVYDSAKIVGYDLDAICYYKDNSIMYFRKVHTNRNLIYNDFSGSVSRKWKNNENYIMLQSSLKNKEYEYEMYTPNSYYIFNRGRISNDTFIELEIISKNKKS